MAYKLLALDLDDTLLDSSRNLSGRNRDAILRARDAGVHIVLASGRVFPSIDLYNKQLGIGEYTIACVGAQVVDGNGTVLFSSYVPPVTATQVMRWAATRGIYFQVFLDDGFHYLQRNSFSDYYEAQSRLSGIESPGLLSLEPVLSSKILFMDEPEKINEYKKEISATFPELQIQTSQPEYLEVLNPEASKASALAFIAQKLGVNSDEIMAIGDSEIDVGMIEYAGLGVAVANAIPHALQAADYVTASNDEHGVAKAIEQFILA